MNKTTSALIGAVVVFVFLATLAATQTRLQLEEKYPKVHAYLVRPNILLTAKYSTDERICEMSLEPVRWTGGTVELFPLSEEETIRVVEEVVPENERGKRRGGLLGTNDKLSVFSGHSYSTPYTYENMTVIFAGTTDKGGADMVAVVTWRDRSCK